MNIFRLMLACALAVVVAITVHAIQQMGMQAGDIFFGDFAHPWRAQFNADFTAHLLLMAAWMIWRERQLWIGVLCGILAIVMGGAFSLAYILVASFNVKGDVRKLLLGAHA
ncbi:MAG: hypothetical protein ABW049_03075 [Spongiibacteraceae bacterium]